MPTKANVHNSVDRLLLKHGLRRTPLRLNLLSALARKSQPVGQGEILALLEKKLPTVDRVSVYRNLRQLKTAGVIHEVHTNQYVLCGHECARHAHVLLFCELCHRFAEPTNHRHLESFFAAAESWRFFDSAKPVFLQGTCRTCTSAGRT